MVAIALLAILSNGYIIINGCQYYSYRLHRYDGQLLYIKATFFGMLAVSASFIIDSFLKIVDYICKLLPQSNLMPFTEAGDLQKYLVFFLFSLLLSGLCCILVKLYFLLRVWWRFRGVERRAHFSYNKLVKTLLMYDILKDSPLDTLLFLSYVKDIFLLITMSDRKIYVGQVLSLGEPNEKHGPDQEISILPIFSGYRDKDTLSVFLDNDYANDDDSKDFQLILKQENIVSACEFVASLYIKNLQKNHANTKL